MYEMFSKPKNIQQLTGDLPRNRVTPLAPFSHTGVDFTGPVLVHHLGRGTRPTKVYFAVFICFSIKAVHLELVSDLTTKAFLAYLKRFIGRSGKPIAIYSDNATNFIGKHVYRMYQVYLKSRLQKVKQIFSNARTLSLL